MVRVHTRCTAGDVFAADCHCREVLDHSMRMIAEEGCGVILYLHNTSRGFEIDQAPVPEPTFDSAREFRTGVGRTSATRDGIVGVIDKTGSWVFQTNYQQVDPALELRTDPNSAIVFGWNFKNRRVICSFSGCWASQPSPFASSFSISSSPTK